MNRRSCRLVRLGAALLAALWLAWLASGCGGGTVPTDLGLQSNPTVVATLGGSSTTVPANSATQTSAAALSGSTATATVGGVTLDYPKSWLTQASGGTGLTIAQQRQDLTSAPPRGARFVVEVTASGSADMRSVLQGIMGSGSDAAAATGLAVVAQPQQIQIGSQQAVLVILQKGSGQQSTVSCYVVADLADGMSVTLTLEAPAAQWEASRPALETILQSVRLP
jgi:hypothetical protein